MKQSVVKASDENDEVKKRKKPSRKNKMLIICREFSVLLLFTFTAYATILNSQPKTKKGAPSLPFFGNSNVDDFYHGDLSQLMHEVSSATYSFVFFYAPWDADSQDLKNEFLETSEFYANQVYFAGVNCWEPGSECRVRFKDAVERYPQLVAYIGLERAVEYKGPRKADHMIKFLHSIMHPIIRLNSISDMWKLRFVHDAVLVGYLRINGPYETGLNTLYETALSLASKDYLRRIAISVFTHTRFNSIMNVSGTPTIHLYIWNKKFEYNGTLKRGALFKWVMETIKGQLVSTDGLLFLKPPTVVMFTPIHPLSYLTPSYVMLRRVAMTSKVAIKNGTFEEDFFSYIIKQNTALQSAYYQEFSEREANSRRSCLKLIGGTQTCSVLPKWTNNTCTAYKPRKLSISEERDLYMFRRQEEECKILDRAPLLPPTVPPPEPGLALNISFGFACLDSQLFKHLAEALGIDLSSEPDNTAIVVIGEEEMTKVPSPDENVLWSVLEDWSNGKRERTVVTWADNKPLATPQEGRVYLPELNLSTFMSLVQQTQQHALILYHSRYCGACARASHMLLELANLLNNHSCLYIARIDGDKVDVPWHFSLHFFPSLLFLPGLKKSESRLFPADTPWVFGSLTGFIIANLNVEERPEVMLSLCAKWGQFPEKSFEGSECIRETRRVSIEGIEVKLREARRKRDRKLLLVQLSFLKAVHLALARVTDIRKTVATIKSLSKEFKVGCSIT